MQFFFFIYRALHFFKPDFENEVYAAMLYVSLSICLFITTLPLIT